jgi:hypothetical protein
MAFNPAVLAADEILKELCLTQNGVKVEPTDAASGPCFNVTDIYPIAVRVVNGQLVVDLNVGPDLTVPLTDVVTCARILDCFGVKTGISATLNASTGKIDLVVPPPPACPPKEFGRAVLASATFTF